MRRFHDAKRDRLAEVVIWGAGASRREFLFSEDLASIIPFLLNRKPLAGAFNVGSGQEVSIRELAETISDVVGYDGQLVFDESKPEGATIRCLDSSKMNGLGWRASTGLRKGLEKTYQWFSQQDFYRGKQFSAEMPELKEAQRFSSSSRIC